MGFLLTIVGARPQFIKAGPVSRALAARGIREVVLHTGQHYDAGMTDVFFRELDLVAPTHHLGVGSGSHGAQTAAMLEGIEKAILERRPAAVLVFGDTNSTLAGALAAAKLQVPVVHVEAGLRSWNRHMPEELNRVATDHASAILFAPTRTACANLQAEGLQELQGAGRDIDWTRSQRFVLSGDVMVDAVRHYADSPQVHEAARALDHPQGGYFLATLHRPQNTDDPEVLGRWLEALASLGRPVLFPVHPRTRALMRKHGLDARAGGSVRFVEPLGYFAMLAAQKGAAAVLTDSGGVQKEAFVLGVPCITLRPETEWVETLEAGWNRLCPEPDRLGEEIAGIAPRGTPPAVYGDGHAAERIADILASCLDLDPETP